MKTLRFSILGLLAMTVILCRAQDGVISTNGGWYSIDAIVATGATNSTSGGDGSQTVQVMANFQPQTPPTPPVIAEVITPEIQALADGLQDDPLKIYNYVHDHIRYVHYFGSKKGAELTLLEKSGNDFDQCALLVALLRAAGYSDASYQFGWMLLPYDSANHQDIHHFLNLDLTNSVSTWSTTTSFLDNYFGFERGYPITAHNWGNNIYGFQRVWVTVTVGGINYNLDPAFKVTERISGVDLPTSMGFSVSGLTNAAGGIDFGSFATNFYTTNINEAAIRGTLAGYTTNLLNYIRSNYPNASVEQILSGQYVIPSTSTALSQCFPFQTTNWNGTMPSISWLNEPTNMMATFAISYLGATYQWFTPQLQGQRLSLTVSSSGSAQLWQDDTNVATASTGGGNFYLTVTTYYPSFQSSWNTTSNTFIPGGPGQPWESATRVYQGANANYAILYAFDPDWGWLQARQNKLDAYLTQGLASSSRQVLTETLNVMGLNWQVQVETMQRIIAQKTGTSPMFWHRVGRMSQESGHGYYVDVYLIVQASTSSSSQNDNHATRWFDEFCYFGSAMEHGMIEQQQSTNLVAASTVKMLEVANTNHQAIYLANSTNWGIVQTKLSNYVISDLTGLINAGFQLLLPQNGSFAVSGSSSPWTGYGFIARYGPGGGTQMLVGPGYFGGYAGDLGATINTTWVNYSYYSQPLYFSSAPVSVPNITAADPVNMADGTFQVQATDLSLGQTEPRGLSFSRYYSSSRRNSNLAGIAPGWLHNYYLNAAAISSPQAGLGKTTPAQMASMMVSITAANAFYNSDQPDPRNWVTTALIAKWGIDQLTAKAVSVSLGKDTVQFIQQPDGSYTPPANCTMTLTQNGSAYSLQERHGRTFKFNTSGWGTNIVDQYGQSVTLGYNSSNWVTSATDLKNHSLTFNYSSTSPVRLISVSDNGGRSISLGFSSSNDLAYVTDPESKTNKFLYDTNHQIAATFNGLGQLVASNIYNGFGRITTQYTQGNTNKTWRVFWSGWQTVSQDPAGGQQIYFYDDKTRLIGQQNALGSLSQKIYDGQDHIVATISPLWEINQFIYDANHNLLETIDPLGFTNQFFYDGQNNLIRAVDANGNPSTFGYNNQFSLIGQTNGAGDWINLTYNSDGTPASRTDSGGAVQYDGYDTYGQLNHITYPNGDHESFGNNPFGDVTSHTNGNGNITTFSYNNRRQLTNSVAPTNVIAKLAYDAAGNQLSATDARGNTASNVWSATGNLLAVILPSTPQGTPVTTNSYDNRDWLTQTLNPLQKAMQFTDDSAGHLLAMTDPLSRTATLGYDADGHTIVATNAAREVTRQTWDARGKLIQLTDGAQHASSGRYDGAGNQIILTNRNGQVWQFQFDGANRLNTTTSPGTRQTVLTWNHQGLLNTVKDPLNQTTTLNYDGKRRLTNRVDNVGTTTFAYDANNNQTSVTENGATNIWTYDAYNHVSSYKDIYGNLIQYRYDANGNLTNLIYPGGRMVAYFYDSLNRLTNVTDWAQRKTAIAYDLAGHVTSITRPNGSYRTMSYDAAGQLSNVWEQMANTLPIAWFRFNWNSNATVNWEFLAPLPHSVTVPTRTMTYDSDNRLATFNGTGVSVDADGNLTSGPLTNSTFVTYAFDARNHLQNVGGATNTYDPAGNRIGITIGTNTTRFVVNPNAGLPQVLMRIRNSVTNYYVYGPGLLYQVTETATATNTLTYHYDYRGSTIALTGDNGIVTDRIEYSAYGLTTYRAGTNDTPFLFNGKYGVMTDPNGLLYMQARYYNPYLCRFISQDPSGFGGGLNMYAAFNGNPVSYLDPFGLGAVSDNLLVSSSWFNAPTPEEQQMQQVLAGFVNLVTLGGANLISSATSGTDLTGNNLNVADAFEQSLETTAFVSSLAFSLPADVPAITLDGVGGDVLLNQTLRLVDTLDWSTAPDTAVVYSGVGQRTLATSFAQQNNLMTIEMTQGGQQLQADLVFQRLTRPQQYSVWEYASTPFAQGASGNVNAFVLNPRPASTFLNVELPILRANPDVNLIHH